MIDSDVVHFSPKNRVTKYFLSAMIELMKSSATFKTLYEKFHK